MARGRARASLLMLRRRRGRGATNATTRGLPIRRLTTYRRPVIAPRVAAGDAALLAGRVLVSSSGRPCAAGLVV